MKGVVGRHGHDMILPTGATWGPLAVQWLSTVALSTIALSTIVTSRVPKGVTVKRGERVEKCMHGVDSGMMVSYMIAASRPHEPSHLRDLRAGNKVLRVGGWWVVRDDYSADHCSSGDLRTKEASKLDTRVYGR